MHLNASATGIKEINYTVLTYLYANETDFFAIKEMLLSSSHEYIV